MIQQEMQHHRRAHSWSTCLTAKKRKSLERMRHRVPRKWFWVQYLKKQQEWALIIVRLPAGQAGQPKLDIRKKSRTFVSPKRLHWAHHGTARCSDVFRHEKSTGHHFSTWESCPCLGQAPLCPWFSFSNSVSDTDLSHHHLAWLPVSSSAAFPPSSVTVSSVTGAHFRHAGGETEFARILLPEHTHCRICRPIPPGTTHGFEETRSFLSWV